MTQRFNILLICMILPILLLAQSKKGIARLLPHHAKLQFAGGIGFLSAGLGYESKKKKFQGDFYYGYVPERIGGINIHSVTGKFSWTPLSSYPKKQVRLDLLTTGIWINYVFGRQYFLYPENHPLKYYGVPTALHTALFIGQGIRWKRVGVYYELGTTDKELSSFITNARSLKFTSILNLGIGIRMSFRKSNTCAL